MRVMLDINIFVSMIFFPSVQTRELARRLTDSHQIVVCDYVIEELRLVTDRKFPTKKKFLDRFFVELPFELVYTPKELDLNEFPEMRDIKDSPILAAATAFIELNELPREKEVAEMLLEEKMDR